MSGLTHEKAFVRTNIYVVETIIALGVDKEEGWEEEG
jgi:hypothetical protein